MDRYKIIPKIAQACGTGAGVIASKYATDWIARLSQNTPVVLGIAVIVFFIASKSLQFAFDLAFDHIRLLRRFFLGRTFVEGKWLETIIKDNKVVSIGLAEFRPDGYSIAFSGTVFDFEDYVKATHSADIAELRWPTLCVKHSNKPSLEDISRLEGYGELQFDYRPGMSLTYRGFFTHLTESARYSVVATKITSKHDLKLLDDSTATKTFIQTNAQIILQAYQPSLEGKKLELTGT